MTQVKLFNKCDQRCLWGILEDFF